MAAFSWSPIWRWAEIFPFDPDQSRRSLLGILKAC
jgi:hypothetical protein